MKLVNSAIGYTLIAVFWVSLIVGSVYWPFLLLHPETFWQRLVACVIAFASLFPATGLGVFGTLAVYDLVYHHNRRINLHQRK
jgi:hypothetical protein